MQAGRNKYIIKKIVSALGLFMVLICCSFLPINSSSYSLPGFDLYSKKVFNAIYNYDFSKADSLIKKSPSSISTNWQNMLKANYYWWLLMSGEEKNQDLIKKFQNTLNTVIKDLKNRENLNDEDLYCLITAQALKSRLNLMEGNYFKGLYNIDFVVACIGKSLGKEKSNDSFIITSGLLYYFSEYAVIKYPFTKPYFKNIKDAGMARGLAVLERGAFSKDEVVKTESNYFLVKIYQEVEHKPLLALPHLKSLCNWYPDNILYWYQYFDCLLSSNQKDEALKVLSKIHLLSNTNATLTEKQKSYFINRSKNRLTDYYKSTK